MQPAKCPNCGKSEWRHVCGSLRMAGSTPARLPRVGAEKQVQVLPNGDPVPVIQGLDGSRGMAAGKDRHSPMTVAERRYEKYKTYQAAYMREVYRPRAKAKKGQRNV